MVDKAEEAVEAESRCAGRFVCAKDEGVVGALHLGVVMDVVWCGC